MIIAGARENRYNRPMFSDTHFHFEHSVQRGADGTAALCAMAEQDCFFALDVGTKCDDLPARQSSVEAAIAQMPDERLAARAREFMRFTAGIWPDVNAIHERDNHFALLQKMIASASCDDNTLHRKIVALGECGIDHHWNPDGVDGRREDDFDQKTYTGERELFEAQLDLARRLSLPVIVHSRDAFADTMDCIKNVGYDNGIIHCYSYGIDEARAFLDRGWYIAFGGAVTYNKKARLEAVQNLLRFIPADRLLCETDSPYLAPVPMRGTVNTPANVKYVYDFIAATLGCTPAALSDTVDKNIRRIFKL